MTPRRVATSIVSSRQKKHESARFRAMPPTVECLPFQSRGSCRFGQDYRYRRGDSAPNASSPRASVPSATSKAGAANRSPSRRGGKGKGRSSSRPSAMPAPEGLGGGSSAVVAGPVSASLPSTSLSPALVATVLHAADVSCLAQVKAIRRAASLAASLGHGHALPFVRIQEKCLLYCGAEDAPPVEHTLATLPVSIGVSGKTV